MRHLAMPLALLVTLAGTACAGGPTTPDTAAVESARFLKASGQRSRSIVIKCRNDDAALRAAKACGGRWVRKIRGTRLHVLDLLGGDPAKAISRCRSEQGVEHAEEDAEVFAAGSPVAPAPLAGNVFERLNAPAAWAVTQGEGATVAVLDTGLDADHPAFGGKVAVAANFTGTASADDMHGHGTHLAGLVAGAPGSALAPGAKLLVGKVLGDDGTGITSAVTDGIVWAANQGADVILLGLITRAPSQALEDAVAFAEGKGALVVAAAGNDHSAAKVHPAAYPEVLAVGALTLDGGLAPFSTFGGHWVDIGAPGAAIPGERPNHPHALQGQGAALSGTSVAAALVAGEAALLYATTDRSALAAAGDDEARRLAARAAMRQVVRTRIETRGVIDSRSPWWFLRFGRIDVGRALTP
ncbi:MAG: S8 family serine peptidase [Candidatus Sericytochromatia bacterium]